MLKISSEKNSSETIDQKIGQNRSIFKKSVCFGILKVLSISICHKNRVFNLLLSDFFEKSTKNADFGRLRGVLQKIAENKVNFFLQM